MPRVDFSHILSSNKKSTDIKISVDGKVVAGMNLSATEMETLITNLANQRAMMLPEVSPKLIAGVRLPSLVEPVLGTAEERFPEGRLLAVRHPGLGWLALMLSDEHAQMAAGWLTRTLRE